MTMSGPPLRRLRHALCSLYFLIAQLSARPNSPNLDVRQQINPDPTAFSTSNISPPLTISDLPEPSPPPVSGTAPIQPPLMLTSSDSLPSPSATLSTFVSPNDDNHEEVDRTSGVVNLYFLLLGVFIAVLILIYWVLARRRRDRKLASATRRQDALAADLSRGPSIGGFHGQIGTQAGVSNGGSRFGRWRTAMGVPLAETPEREEGLNERGEAPPPYLAKLPKAVTVEGRAEDDEEAMELNNLGHRGGVRPPDYSPPSSSAGRTRL